MAAYGRESGRSDDALQTAGFDTLVDVAASPENYADLLRQTGRGTEATTIEARTETIRAKHTEQNP